MKHSVWLKSCLCNTLVKRIRSGKQERGTDNIENIKKKHNFLRDVELWFDMRSDNFKTFGLLKYFMLRFFHISSDPQFLKYYETLHWKVLCYPVNKNSLLEVYHNTCLSLHGLMYKIVSFLFNFAGKNVKILNIMPV